MQRFKLIAAAVVAAASVTAAQAQSYYVGASVGQSDYKIDTTGAANADTKDTGFKVFGGAMLTPNFGIEAAYFDLGKITGSGVEPGIGRVSLEGQASGIALLGVAVLPLGEASLFAKAGIAQVKGEIDARTPLGNLRFDDTSTQPMFGVGASYAFTKNLGARIEWERVRVRYSESLKDDTDLISAGVTYRF